MSIQDKEYPRNDECEIRGSTPSPVNDTVSNHDFDNMQREHRHLAKESNARTNNAAIRPKKLMNVTAPSGSTSLEDLKQEHRAALELLHSLK